MTYQEVLALDEPGAAPDDDNTTISRPTLTERVRARLASASKSIAWIFRRSEGVGWMLALALNISTAGWLGVAIWAVMFAVAISLETAAEEVVPADD